MNTRLIASGALTVLCLLLVWTSQTVGVRIHGLRVEQGRLIQKLNPQAENARQLRPEQFAPAHSGASSELLRLRNEVTQLTAKKRELNGVKSENERLHAQLTNPRTTINSIPGYMRKTQAQRVGFASPENTMQTLLWALQNRDLTSFLNAFTPAAAERIKGDQAFKEDPSGGKFMNQAQAFVGVGILRRKSEPDGSMQLQVQILPELPPAEVRMELVNGEWKIASPL